MSIIEDINKEKKIFFFTKSNILSWKQAKTPQQTNNRKELPQSD